MPAEGYQMSGHRLATQGYVHDHGKEDGTLPRRRQTYRPTNPARARPRSLMEKKGDANMNSALTARCLGLHTFGKIPQHKTLPTLGATRASPLQPPPAEG